MKGKIVFFEGEKKFGFAEEPIPKVEDGAVLVKVLCTNICGSDVKNWKGSSAAAAGSKPSCQDLSFRGQCGQPVMRTGPMSQDF